MKQDFVVFSAIFLLIQILSLSLQPSKAQMAESVDALVSNTSGATHPGSTPGLGTALKDNTSVTGCLQRYF